MLAVSRKTDKKKKHFYYGTILNEWNNDVYVKKGWMLLFSYYRKIKSHLFAVFVLLLTFESKQIDFDWLNQNCLKLSAKKILTVKYQNCSYWAGFWINNELSIFNLKIKGYFISWFTF